MHRGQTAPAASKEPVPMEPKAKRAKPGGTDAPAVAKKPKPKVPKVPKRGRVKAGGADALAAETAAAKAKLGGFQAHCFV